MDPQELIASLLNRSPSDEVLRRFPTPGEEMPMMLPAPGEEERDDSERFPTPELEHAVAQENAPADSPQGRINELFNQMYDKRRPDYEGSGMSQLDLTQGDAGAADLLPDSFPSMKFRTSPEGWRAFMQGAPESVNVEDRRDFTVPQQIEELTRPMTQRALIYAINKGKGMDQLKEQGTTYDDLVQQLDMLSRGLR